ncbi:MAG TPA: ribosome maturation factor RimP [Acidimicrobiales bacterium]|nr:ribosome maturation factor RimP [Acidimicrobiales bacterium]
MATTEQVTALVAPIVATHQAELYDVELVGGVLRVLVDRTGGVDLDTVGAITREVSDALDEADPLPGEYTLEVSSPGLERPLRTPRHFAAAVGSAVKVKTMPGTDGERRVEGELLDADDDAITVESPDGPRRIELAEIASARTVFTWGPAPKPGGKGGTQSKARKGAQTRKANR